MEEVEFDSALTDEQIAENFKDISLFDGLMNGLNDALAFEKGTARAETYARKRSLPEVDVAKERNTLQMTQKSFAALIGVSKRTVEAWESGKCNPSPTAKKLIHLISIDPSIVQKLQQ